MNRLLRLLCCAAIAIWPLSAWPQSFTMPPPAGVYVMGCVYNTTPPTLTNGEPAYTQCGPEGGIVADIRSTTLEVTVTPTVTASSAYAAGDEVGGLMTFTGLVLQPKLSGRIDTIWLTSKTVQTAEFDVYICNANPSNSTWADKTVPSINVADVTKCGRPIPLTANYSGLGTHTSYIATGIGMSVVLPTTSLYVVLITPQIPSAEFGSTSDLTLGIDMIPD